MGEHDAKQIGTQVGNRAHQQASGTTAFDDDLVFRAVALFSQLLHAGDEVGEGIALPHHLARIVPSVAQVTAAADVRVGYDDASVEHGKARDGEADGQAVAVRAVTVEVERVGGIFCKAVAAVDE